MKHIIIGTAGHIDHGKTTLIKALTNIETDRFEEEKRRGITIDIGFAFFDLPSGKRAGIVDVPGHERFIKNMLAGVSGIDLVLFVISAEEGVMPQTQEHLDILNILDVQKGIVVLTKKDLVDEDWIKLIKEDLKKTFEDTFLEDAPIVSVSSVTKDGFDELIDTIEKVTEEVDVKSVSSAMRMPIDRVFTLQGFGTIVTGTLVEGKVNEGETLILFPSMKEAKLRSIQVHNHNEVSAYAGQRVAINLTGIKKTEIHRGEILAHPESMQVTSMLDVKLKLLKHSERTLANWTRLRLYHGTKEILCRLVLLDKEFLQPGEECFAQLRLEEPTACKYGDRFVIRFYSPLETIGGGVILDPNAHKHKRFKDEIIDELLYKEAGNPSEIIENLILKHSHSFLNLEEYVKLSGLPIEEIKEHLIQLKADEIILELSKNVFIHKGFIIEKSEELIKMVNAYHEKYPMRLGLLKEEVRTKVFPDLKPKVFDEVLQLFTDVIRVEGKYMSYKDFEIIYTSEQQALIHQIMDHLDKEAFKPTSMPELLEAYKQKHIRDLINNLVDTNQLVKINDQIYLTQMMYEKAKDLLKNEFTEKGQLSLGECKDILDTSRKYIVPIMEHFDNRGFTKRVGDQRMLR
ncbi:MAG: selenocysteine-specific translation elongation factor [Clostridia bacterium]|nr:selenocysteine-specific translation elongation factor [Clostridia bacterium]